MQLGFMMTIVIMKPNCIGSVSIVYSPLSERPRLSLRTINQIQSGMLVRKCISGEKSDIVLSNHNYDGRQIKAKWKNEEFG